MLAPVYYIDYLAQLHERLAPRTYLEIGIRNGHSLAQCRSRGIGIDPAFEINQALPGAVSLVRATSDDYFAGLQVSGERPFGDQVIDLAFIDGMHLFEFALRDFVNVERYVGPASVVVFDDMFPRDIDEAARDRHTQAWTGDVFRLMLALREYRSDLVLIGVDTQPTGLLLVTGFDPACRLPEGRVDAIAESEVRPDPQPIPDEVLQRQGALAPDAALELLMQHIEGLRASTDLARGGRSNVLKRLFTRA